MKLKKVLALMMAMSVLVCSTACGSTDNSDVKGEIKSEESGDEAEEVVVSLGTASGTVYESQFMGLGWNLPTDWVFMTEDEIAEMNASVSEALDSEDISSQLEDGSVFCDMYAYSSLGDTINIQIEKLEAASALLMDEDAYADLSIEQLPAAFENMGYTAEVEKCTVTIAGEEHVGISAVISADGVTVYEKLGFIKVGQYMCVLTVASGSADTLDTAFGNFYSLD